MMLEFCRHPRVAWNWIAAGLLLGGLCAGCETPGWAQKLEKGFSSSEHRSPAAEEERYRRKYMATHDQDALFWLLRHRVSPGTSYKDVCRTLGEEGTRETRDNWLKTNGGNYQVGDDAYAFGPDSVGRTLYLFFRDDKLVNFDPGEFRESTHRHSEDRE